MSGATTMSRITRWRQNRWLAAALAAGLLIPSMGGAPAAAGKAPPQVGIICTSGPTFTLSTKTGSIDLPDGRTAFMWGYSSGDGGFQHPGPVLCVNEGQTVSVTLKNTGLNVPVSIAFPGQENVTANGQPAAPEFDGSGNMTSETTSVAAGGTITYSFVASRPGTFLYESGTDPQTQVRMGLFGALIVRPALGADYAYDNPKTRFTTSTNSGPNTGEEFMILLSEIDPVQHAAVQKGKPFDLSTYKPRYWLVNGRGFPDAIADNNASWLPYQPYGSLALVHPFDGSHPYPGLARYLSVGTEDYPFHPHGNNGSVIGRDGNPLVGADGKDISFEKFSLNIGPGQTWDVLFKYKDAEAYADTPGNQVPVTPPNLNDLELGMFYGGSPYLGQTATLPPGKSTLNECGEFYIIAHNHALYQITSWGVNMTGPITYMRVDPPLPNSCP
jgi:FtsP/CotA-like multicopper oxidase with cupredoxin domain